MLTPDERARALRFLDAHAPPGTLLQCGVTGAHAYGFLSPDSDVDLKGVHLAPTAALLGLGGPKETHDVLVDFEEVEHDLTTHEAAKALGLLARGNGNVLERLLSPLQLVASDDVEALRELARGAMSTRFAPHYRGFFQGVMREHAREPKVKSMLYAYRTALTGVHLLRTGELEMDLRPLADRYGFPELHALVETKRRGEEKGALDPEDDARHRARWPELESMLAAALERSSLPHDVPNRDAMSAWLVERRLRAL
ncbi:MAG: nucleotidyltransferase domain-containing protein [Sandaracinus sp.]|nr:nucleotidyltransferase domain-containing protein [Sandaracinus sp.]MCB9612754.1 nucleotidyltransferase domain-containing protein [Sandaracinus sp.]MCB9631775.1 nucleotidyltransferase domain-containing protein [Sandaracinus sp.]